MKNLQFNNNSLFNKQSNYAADNPHERLRKFLKAVQKKTNSLLSHRPYNAPCSTPKISLMSRIDLASKNLLANCFHNFTKKDLKETAIRKV